MKVYSGTSNPKIAKKIAKHLNVPLADMDISRFPNQEVKVWIKEDKIHKQAIVVQSFVKHPNKSIIEFCLIVDALRRSGAREITAVIPWMGYCIQDKIFRQGEPLSAKVIADIIQSTKVDKVITFDLHNETIQGFFNMRIAHLSAVPLFLNIFKEKRNIDIVVAPDVGALKETTKIAHELNIPIAILNKKRDLHTGKVEIIGVDGEVQGKKALIMDDFISTGGTLIQTANYLKNRGVEHISVAVTHHLFIPNVMQKLAESPIDDLYISDTIHMPDEEKYDQNINLHIESVSKLIAKNID